MFWFGLIYMFFYRHGDVVLPADGSEPTPVRVFRESFLLMVSFHTEKYDAPTSVGLVALAAHSTIGLLMTLVVLARFIAVLPQPRSKDDFEK